MSPLLNLRKFDSGTWRHELGYPGMILRRVHKAWYCLLVSALCVSRPAFADDVYVPGAKSGKNYETFARPFLEQHCLSCHDNDTQTGDLSLEHLGPVNESNAALWKTIWAQVTLQQMPPKDAEQPNTVDRLFFSDWVVEELVRVMKDKGGFQAHLDPKKGNYLNHDLIFGPLPKNVRIEPTSSPARMWRVNREERLTRLNDLVNKEPEYDPEKPGFRTYGDVVPVDYDGVRKLYFALDRLVIPKNGPCGDLKSTVKSAIGVLSDARDHGLRDYPNLYTVNSAEALQIFDQAKDIINYMAHGPEFFIPYPDKQISDKPYGINRDLWGVVAGTHYGTKIVRPITPVYDLMRQEGASDDRMRAAVDYLFEALTFRPPTRKESDQHFQLVKASVTKLGKEKGAPMGLATVFLDRNSLFRPELVQYGKPDSHGRVMLQDWELGLAVNHALRYVKPDKALKDAILSGRMKTRADVKREVDRILNDDSISKPRILRFFQTYFDYDLAGSVCKDAEVLGKTRIFQSNSTQKHYRAMHRERESTDRLVQLILQEDKQVLRRLLTTDKIIYTPRNDWKNLDYTRYWFETAESLVAARTRKRQRDPKSKTRPVEAAQTKPEGRNATPIYVSVQRPHLDPRFSMKEQRMLTVAPKGQRLGILTHPAWLVSHSDAMDNHAIHRGIWIRERLLGGGLPDVPITVDAMLPCEPKSTLRHRMRVTKADYCWTCHKKVDPLGLTFESYNQIGMFRTTEKGKPVDATGEIIDSGDPELDGKVNNAFEMINKLAESERVEQVFVRHVFRFWMGRNETLNDRPVLQAAHKAYKDSGGSMKTLLVSLLTSDAFLFRRVALVSETQ